MDEKILNKLDKYDQAQVTNCGNQMIQASGGQIKISDQERLALPPSSPALLEAKAKSESKGR